MAYAPLYKSTSPYFRTPIRGRFMMHYEPRDIPPDRTDRMTIILRERYVHRPDNLAFDLYQDDNYWWVFGVRNGLQDPIFDLVLKRILIIPNIEYLRRILA